MLSTLLVFIDAAAAAAPPPSQVSDGRGAAALVSLSRLQVLDLSCSSISNSGLLRLGSLTDLVTLNLDMCRVGDEAARVSEA